MHRIEINLQNNEVNQIDLTPEEIKEIEDFQYVDTRTYAEKRSAEYPPITDYIDGVVKGDQEQIDAYIAACLAVKAKYPKPEQGGV